MKYCQNCGTALNNFAEICPNCGEGCKSMEPKYKTDVKLTYKSKSHFDFNTPIKGTAKGVILTLFLSFLGLLMCYSMGDIDTKKASFITFHVTLIISLIISIIVLII